MNCFKGRVAGLGVSIAVALALTTGIARAQDAPDDEAAILALIEETQQANNAGDVERWVALFTDDAKQLVIYRRDPATGEWRIARMMSNSNTF